VESQEKIDERSDLWREGRESGCGLIATGTAVKAHDHGRSPEPSLHTFVVVTSSEWSPPKFRESEHMSIFQVSSNYRDRASYAINIACY
jgi:hypothetical protein